MKTLIRQRLILILTLVLVFFAGVFSQYETNPYQDQYPDLVRITNA